MVSQEDLALFEIVDDVEAAWEFMWRRGLTAHTPPAHQRAKRPGAIRKVKR